MGAASWRNNTESKAPDSYLTRDIHSPRVARNDRYLSQLSYYDRHSPPMAHYDRLSPTIADIYDIDGETLADKTQRERRTELARQQASM